MELARSLHMTLSQLFKNADSRELGLWTALARIEAQEQKAAHDKRQLIARAESALAQR